MKNNLLEKIKKYSLVLYWILLFSVASALLFLILPSEPRFKFEYQKGQPWKHDNLVAPFDFAILKSAADLEAEIAEATKMVIPYFVYDTAKWQVQLEKLKSDFGFPADTVNLKKVKIFSQLKAKLEEIYRNGILMRSVESYPELTGKQEIKKRVGPSIYTIEIARLHSEKSAYNEVHELIAELSASFPSQKKWLETISPEKYITANLEYDKITTEKEINEIKAMISPSRGMVQAGERIILQGEIVDDEKFQLLESLKASYTAEESTGFNRYMVSTGKALLIMVLMGLIFAFLYIFRRDVLGKARNLAFLMISMVGIVFIAHIVNIAPGLSIYLVPIAIFPIIVRTFFDSRTAIFMLIITVILIGFYAPNNYEYILLQVTSGIVAVFSLSRMHRRGHLVLATFWVLLTLSVVYTAINLLHESTFSAAELNMYKWLLISSVLILLVYPLIYIFEKIFGFVSDVTLIEISDTNQPLLRKLAEQAPGTFQHSMQIANLAEEIILRIGGNPFLVRAGALYHDIGKISKPNFFVENQVAGLNPHDKMSYIQSAEIIIDHVKNGVKMAQKHKLPAPIIEFIATHHGTTRANYFYVKHVNENSDNKKDEDSFSYPGPLPQSKEAAVVMLVDGIEAASRSLQEKTYDKLKILIDDMIDQKIKLKQLDHSQLTFHDISVIKEVLLNKLMNIYHVRIEYPKEEKKEK